MACVLGILVDTHNHRSDLGPATRSRRWFRPSFDRDFAHLGNFERRSARCRCIRRALRRGPRRVGRRRHRAPQIRRPHDTFVLYSSARARRAAPFGHDLVRSGRDAPPQRLHTRRPNKAQWTSFLRVCCGSLGASRRRRSPSASRVVKRGCLRRRVLSLAAPSAMREGRRRARAERSNQAGSHVQGERPPRLSFEHMRP